MKKIIVIGGGGHAKVVISILKRVSDYEILGYTDKEDRGVILGIQYLGTDSILESKYREGIEICVLGIGQIKSTELRKTIVEYVQALGYHLPTLIAPTAIINEDVQINKGTVIMDGVVINSGSKIGKYAIINTNSSIDHDCIVGDYTHIAPGVTLSGNVEIGDNVLIGTGSCIIQERKVESSCIVAAGSSVQSSLLEPGIYRGNPARLIKKFQK